MLTIEQQHLGKETLLLSLHGDLNVETVAELRLALLDAFSGTPSQILVNADDLSMIDFYGIQLLCSAHRTSVARKKQMVWQHGRPPQIDAAMRISGFTRHCGCSLCPDGVDCMWI
jgi:anti-anti-sigma factor